MGIKLTKLPELSSEDLSDRETLLLQLLREREECIQQLSDQIARLKGEKGKPKIKPSRLEAKEKAEKEGATIKLDQTGLPYPRSSRLRREFTHHL